MRMMGLKNSLVAAAMCGALVIYIHYMYSLYPKDRPIVMVEYPYVYRFSSFNKNFPGVTVSELSVDCLPLGAATVTPGGRLGNLIMEYWSLWTAARVHNLTAFVPPELRQDLDKVFESLDVPKTSEFLARTGCPEGALDEARKHLFKVNQETTPLYSVVAQAKEVHAPIFFEMCIILPETIVPLAAEVRRHFRFQPSLRKYAEDRLRSLRETVQKTSPNVKEVVFAGVHVRRTDYAAQLRYLYNSDRPANETYYGRAALWLQSTVVPPGGELVLVVASDDPHWVQEVLLPHLKSLGLKHSFMGGDGKQEKPERDMALLSSCNHSVFAYGTYGLSSALMTGGRAAVYNLSHEDAVSPAMQFAQHMPGWVIL